MYSFVKGIKVIKGIFLGGGGLIFSSHNCFFLHFTLLRVSSLGTTKSIGILHGVCGLKVPLRKPCFVLLVNFVQSYMSTGRIQIRIILTLSQCFSFSFNFLGLNSVEECGLENDTLSIIVLNKFYLGPLIMLKPEHPYMWQYRRNSILPFHNVKVLWHKRNV